MNDDIQQSEAQMLDLEVVEDTETSLPDIKKKLAGLRERLASCEKERREYLDGWQRARADHINYKKDEAKRLEDIARFASGSLIEDLLPVLDSFDQAIRNNQQSTVSNQQEMGKGFLLIRSQLTDVLKKRGLEAIETKQGDQFNPEYHESVAETEADQEAGTIVEEVQKGYALRGRVIRPVRVTIAKRKE